MATKTLTADKSSLLAKSDTGLNLGGGQDLHLPVSLAAYRLRGLIGWSLPAGFWDDVRKLTKGELLVVGSPVVHVARGASPSVYIYRNTAAWTPNSAGESWSTAAIAYPGPAVTGVGGVGPVALPTGTGVVAIDITEIVLAWAPSSVAGPVAGQVGGNAAQYGVQLQEHGGAAQASEIWSAVAGVSAGNRPVLRLTYDTNSPPAAPTLIEPLGPDQKAASFGFATLDPEGNPITKYDIQVSTDPSFATVSHWNLVGGTSGIVPSGSGVRIDRAYGGTALTNTVRYYWRARAFDSGSASYGAWSSGGTFVKGAGIAVADQYDYWAQAILEDMSQGRIALRLGTLRPTGAEVAALVAADYRDRFDVYIDDVSPIIDRRVAMLGQKVSLSPDGWAVDAIVELVEEEA
jgi:hypothetical protein